MLRCASSAFHEGSCCLSLQPPVRSLYTGLSKYTEWSALCQAWMMKTCRNESQSTRFQVHARFKDRSVQRTSTQFAGSIMLKSAMSGEEISDRQFAIANAGGQPYSMRRPPRAPSSRQPPCMINMCEGNKGDRDANLAALRLPAAQLPASRYGQVSAITCVSDLSVLVSAISNLDQVLTSQLAACLKWQHAPSPDRCCSWLQSGFQD